MEWGLTWLIVGIIAAGIMGPIVRAWGIHLRLLDQERRLTRLEANKLSDMNTEKANKRWNAKKFEDQVVSEAQVSNAPTSTRPWWFPKG